MSLQNNISNDTLIPRDDLEEDQFPYTYLKDVPISRDYEVKNYEDFTRTKFSETILPMLFELFYSWTHPDITPYLESEEYEEITSLGITDSLEPEEQEEIDMWYAQLNALMSNEYFPILERLYRYNKSIHTLDGYKNTKEYLVRALVRHHSLWVKLLDVMTIAASNVRKEMSLEELVRIMESKNPSDQEKTYILKFLDSVMEVCHDLELYYDMAEYSQETSKLLDQIEKILEKHVQQTMRALMN